MHHHSSPLALDTRNTPSGTAVSPGSLSFSSTSTSGGGMAAVASQKEHQHYPPPIADHQQHHSHTHAHLQHHQDTHTDSIGRIGGSMHVNHQQSTSNYLHQSSPPPLPSSASSSVAALQRIAQSASLDPVASQSTSLTLPPVTSTDIDHHHSHHHSFSSSHQHSQVQHPSSNQQHHVHQRHQQQQPQQHYHQDRTSPEELTSTDPTSNDNNNGKNSSSDSTRDLGRNMGSSNGAIVKKVEGDHGGGGISHHGGGHHQTAAASAQHHSSPAPLDRSYSSHTHHGGPHEADLPGHTAQAQYLSANCVIFTYFDKNISEAVNEHFSRSELFRDSSTVGTQVNPSSSPSSVETEKNKGCLPMSQRNFPASFWNSDYQYPVSSVSGASGAASSLSSLAMGHAALISGHHTAADIYGAAAHDPYANLFGYGAAAGNTTGNSGTTSADPWQNYMAAGMGAAYASQRSAAHDMYSAATAAHSRHAAAASAQSHYSSLLQLQNTMRQASMAGSVAAGGLQGRAAASAIDGYAAGSAHSHYGAAGLTAGLEGTMQGSSKELSYWGF